jgi:hypothetical protein
LVKLDPVAASKVLEAEQQDALVVDRPNLIRPTRLPSQRVAGRRIESANKESSPDGPPLHRHGP